MPGDAWRATINVTSCEVAVAGAWPDRDCPVELLASAGSVPRPAAPDTAATWCGGRDTCTLSLDTVAGSEHLLSISPRQVPEISRYRHL